MYKSNTKQQVSRKRSEASLTCIRGQGSSRPWGSSHLEPSILNNILWSEKESSAQRGTSAPDSVSVTTNHLHAYHHFHVQLALLRLISSSFYQSWIPDVCNPRKTVARQPRSAIAPCQWDRLLPLFSVPIPLFRSSDPCRRRWRSWMDSHWNCGHSVHLQRNYNCNNFLQIFQAPHATSPYQAWYID